jgi:hypothetical protein
MRPKKYGKATFFFSICFAGIMVVPVPSMRNRAALTHNHFEPAEPA